MRVVYQATKENITATFETADGHVVLADQPINFALSRPLGMALKLLRFHGWKVRLKGAESRRTS